MIFGIAGMIVALVGIDQWIKYWAMTSLKEIGTIPLINGVFHLTYVENTGSAGGILAGKQIFLIGITSIMILGMAYLLIRKKIPGKFLPWVVGLIIAGGIGNLIDRVARRFVVDYLDFCWIRFPVFNFADCCVVVGIFIVAGFIFFSEQKKDPKKNPEGEGK